MDFRRLYWEFRRKAYAEELRLFGWDSFGVLLACDCLLPNCEVLNILAALDSMRSVRFLKPYKKGA